MLGRHLLGIYEKAFPEDWSWERRLAEAKALGFDYMELSIDESDGRLERLLWSGRELEKLHSLSVEAGLPLMSLCLSAHRRFPLGSRDAEVRAAALEIMRRAIDFAAAIGIRVIQLAGYDVYYEPSTPESVRHFKEGIRAAADMAAQKQVMLAMEIMDTRFMNSITKHMALERDICSPWYKLYPDIGNLSAWPENNVAAELDRGAGSIVAVHLKDTLAVGRDFPGQFRSVPFGSGCVDFKSCFARLEAAGYAGPYMIEMWSSGGPGDSAEIARVKRWLELQFAAGVSETQRCGNELLSRIG